jgi:hypothetical protein
MRAALLGLSLAAALITSKAHGQLEGRYTGRGEGTLSAVVKHAPASTSAYDIVLRTRARTCTGEVSGRAILTGSGLVLKAKTDRPIGCTIRVEPRRNTLKVSEVEGCLYFHGVACGFSGSLRRRR